ncbi:hypothetical protein [Pseudomonas orientalis]|uniref:Uncharacterized protein n=1 Tax=Pseudomonas orientalis TaxID=76758 RepID=A0A2L0RT81_9PSED|nr:hypothetical protein [Pseudomonas orientalis]AUZ45347.1 hypothetical protein BOP93_06970 [Pseudomonas orientalis]
MKPSKTSYKLLSMLCGALMCITSMNVSSKQSQRLEADLVLAPGSAIHGVQIAKAEPVFVKTNVLKILLGEPL